MMCGGPSASRQLDESETAMVVALKGAVEAATKETYATFTPVAAKTQVVAGANYFVKIDVGGDKQVHARVYKAPADAATLAGVQTGKTSADEIELFEPNL